MKPIILISPSFALENKRYTLANFYATAVKNSGGISMISPYENYDDIDDILENIDGLILSGGGDIDASFFNESLSEKAMLVDKNRDKFEIELCKKAVDKNMPILAICRGVQVLNVALGGNIIQHIDGHVYEGDCDLTHKIRIVKDSYFDNLFDDDEFVVNSIHHQALNKISTEFEVLAYCDDIIEAVKHKNKDFIVGVQFHPERIYDESAECKILFDKFISHSVKYKNKEV